MILRRPRRGSYPQRWSGRHGGWIPLLGPEFDVSQELLTTVAERTQRVRHGRDNPHRLAQRVDLRIHPPLGRGCSGPKNAAYSLNIMSCLETSPFSERSSPGTNLTGVLSAKSILPKSIQNILGDPEDWKK